MRALFIQHDHVSPPGLVGEAFDHFGYEIHEFNVVPEERFSTPDVTVDFPELSSYDVVIPMGSPWSVYDLPAIGTWLEPEIALLSAAQERGTPILGLCFGGQLMSVVNGGQVSRSPSPEIGWHFVTSFDEALISTGIWFQWHYDRFTVPPGGTVVARNPSAPQAYTLGRTLGLQFHPEIDPPSLESWLSTGGSEELDGLGLDEAMLLEQTDRQVTKVRPRTFQLVEAFLERVARNHP